MRWKCWIRAVWLVCSLCGCEALYGGYSVGNSNNCVVNQALCQAPDQACNPQTRECEPAILLDAVDPPAAATPGGEILSLSGQRFSADLKVRIGGIDAGPVTLLSDRSLRVVAPPSGDQRGSVAVEILHPAGQTVRKEGLFRYYELTRLGTPQPVALPFAPRHVRSADINQDGRVDLVATDGFSSSIFALLGQGDGRLSAPIATALSARAFGLSLGDVNGDGKTDLAISQTGPMGSIEVALGAGDGTFASSTQVTTQTTVGGFALGDMNSDGKADLVVADDLRLRLFISQGNGTFAAVSQDTALAYQSFRASALVGLHDLNGDASLDVLALNGFDLNFPILTGNGSGAFSERASPIFPSSPNVFSIGDANADGLPDVLVGLGASEPGAALMLQAADRSFRQPLPLSGPRSLSVVEIRDMNGDGVADVVLFSSSMNNGTLSILHGISPARYAAPTTYSVPPFPSLVMALPLSKNPRPELFVVHRGAGGSGNFYSVLSNVTP